MRMPSEMSMRFFVIAGAHLDRLIVMRVMVFGVWILLLSRSVAFSGGGFDYAVLCGKAAQVAASPYVEQSALPDALKKLDYDQTRAIRFDTSKALWRMERLPFQIQGFHPGGIQQDRIRLNWMEGDVLKTFPFSKQLFDYPTGVLEKSIPDGIDFSGFRVHYPLNDSEHLDELLVFQGASYFRMLGAGNLYGISARGIAVNVSTGAPEEFPVFREFWIEKPDRKSREIRILALLDGPSVAGAYEFTVIPGRDTVVDVRAMLFLRKIPEMLGLMPLTSMFWFGENTWSRFHDYRPEVHDSDGLLIHTGFGEWLWRPLSNENQLRYSTFVDHHPQGFGLMQRDRRFASYEDLEANYQLRPSVWIEPLTPWGEGEFRLIEIPATSEYGDNIVVCWVPRAAPLVGQPLEIKYRMHWFSDSSAFPPLGRTISTRISAIPYMPQARKFVLDFSGSPELDSTPVNSLTLEVSASNAKILGKTLMKNTQANMRRAVFDVLPEDPSKPVELRCFLKTVQKPLTETWTYQWLP